MAQLVGQLQRIVRPPEDTHGFDPKRSGLSLVAPVTLHVGQQMESLRQLDRFATVPAHLRCLHQLLMGLVHQRLLLADRGLKVLAAYRPGRPHQLSGFRVRKHGGAPSRLR